MTQRSKTLSLMLCFVLVASLVGVAFARPAAAARTIEIQPQLRQAAEANPDQMVRVMVQKAGPGEAAAAVIEALGGEIIHDLDMINAYAATMPAAAAAELAQSPAVRWVSLDGPVESAGKSTGGDLTNPIPPECGYDRGSGLYAANCYPGILNLQPVWNMGINGNGIGVAIIDSGVSPNTDFNRISKSVSFSSNSTSNSDLNGHGTHVAGILAGNGNGSNGMFKGVAPGINLFALKISDDSGMAYESDAVAALQWVYDSKAMYNIRVVNLSINTNVEVSYHQSALSAAAEILWFNGVVVVASAGNKGSGGNYNTINTAPANDPFIITVGAVDDKNTFSRSDDVLASYSAYGTSLDGFFKPDIMAPGTDIISVLSRGSDWEVIAPERFIPGTNNSNTNYFRISGTSMSAPMVAGAAALLLQDEPNLTPDQVKYRLINATGSATSWVKGKGRDAITYSVPNLDVYAAVTGNTTASANTGLQASQLLWTGDQPVVWGSVAWNSVAWNSVAWNSVAWNSVAWNSVAWNSVAWND